MIDHTAKGGDAYEHLRDLLLKEQTLQPWERDNSRAKETANMFRAHGEGSAEHEMWRESKMLGSMLEILTNRHAALNPQLASQREAGACKDFAPQYSYSQEVDDEGKSQEERDLSRPLLYPDLDRYNVELQAAEAHLTNKDRKRQSEPVEPTPKMNLEPSPKESSAHPKIEVEGKKLSERALANKLGRNFKTVQSAGNTAAKEMKREIAKQQGSGKPLDQIHPEPVRLKGRGGIDQYALVRDSAADDSRSYQKIKSKLQSSAQIYQEP
jgi:hypothetical protein